MQVPPPVKSNAGGHALSGYMLPSHFGMLSERCQGVQLSPDLGSAPATCEIGGGLPAPRDADVPRTCRRNRAPLLTGLFWQ
jgi:hypothetical protein